jgi:hypothetical protein
MPAIGAGGTFSTGTPLNATNDNNPPSVLVRIE